MRTETAELPALDPGVTLLETDVRGALPALVVDRALGRSGRALWADANGHARTRAVADVAPDRRVLRRIEVARGFTAHQHYAIVDRLAERALRAGGVARAVGEDDALEPGVDAPTGTDDPASIGGPAATIDDPAAARAADPATCDAVRDAATRTRDDVALLVAPAIDAPYRDDALRGDEGESMLVRALARLAGVAHRLEVPVLVTRTADDELAAPVANAAAETIRCEETPAGPRFAAEDFETLVYPAGDGVVQTTLAFWRRVLERRVPDRAADDAGAAAVGGAGGIDRVASEPVATGQPAAAEGVVANRSALVRGEPVATAGPTATSGERR